MDDLSASDQKKKEEIDAAVTDQSSGKLLTIFFSFDREPQLLSSKLVKLPAGRKFREITSHHSNALKLAFTGNKHVKRRDNSWHGVKKL